MNIELRGPVLVGADDERDRAWVVGGRLTFEPPSTPGRDVTVIEGWVLPGLVDAHCHVGLGPEGPIDVATQEQQAETERDAGVLLIRDAGSPSDTRWIDDRPDLPEIIRAGRHIARTKRYIRNFADEIEPDDLVSTMIERARTGDGWVKLVGDWIDRSIGDLAPCWPADALAAGIEAAHRAGARVTAHCFGEDCLPDLINAGIDGIEHASGLTDESRAAAAARGVAIVPTLVNIDIFPSLADQAAGKFPAYAAHMRELHAQRYRNIGDAYAAGVPVYCGTDAGATMPHGLMAAEVAELRTAGLPDVAALDAACWGARRWLGRPGLVEGGPADLVVFGADPRADVGVLAAPSAVVLQEKVFRGSSRIPVAGGSAGENR